MQSRQNGEEILDEGIPSKQISNNDTAKKNGIGDGADQQPFVEQPSDSADNDLDQTRLNEDERSPPPADSQRDIEKQSMAPAHDEDNTANNRLAPAVSIDAHGNTYPEGGLRAWLVVYGAWSGMTASFGLMNSIGTFQAYLSTHQLSGLDESTIGWIFSIYTFLAFFCGIQIGPYFDAKGPRVLVMAGTVFLLGGTFGIAESTKYWHFILSFSTAAGLGTALIFTPAVSSVQHFFLVKRATATGIATTGGSIGGIVFPLVLQRLFPAVGFRWGTRILGFIFLFQLIIANILIRSRLPRPAKGSIAGNIWPDWRIYKNITFDLTIAGTFFVEWALFIPLSYLTSYALAQGLNSAFSYQLIAILNVGSFFGRWAPGYLADGIGRFNTMIITIAICIVSVLCLWLTSSLSENAVPQLAVFAVIFGFGSGSNISLVPSCVGQLCKTEVFGRWFAGLYCIVSFGCLTGVPIAGSLITLNHGNYNGLIIFVGACYAAGLLCFLGARVREVGWGLRKKY